MAATESEGSRRGEGDDGTMPARPGTQVKASRRALSARLGKMKEFSHLTGRHLQGTVTKADIAAVQRAADMPLSRRRLSAMAHNLTDDAMRGGGLTTTPMRSATAPRKRPEQRDMSKGKSAVYSRDLLRSKARARDEAMAQTPGPSVPASSDFGRKAGKDPLFLDPGRRKSRGTTPVRGGAAAPAPKSALRGGKQYLADSKRSADDPAAGPARPSHVASAEPHRGSDGGRASLAASRGSRGSGRALAEAESPATGTRQGPNGGEVLVKSQGGCCAVM